jgi:hypothetical protein
MMLIGLSEILWNNLDLFLGNFKCRFKYGGFHFLHLLDNFLVAIGVAIFEILLSLLDQMGGGFVMDHTLKDKGTFKKLLEKIKSENA